MMDSQSVLAPFSRCRLLLCSSIVFLLGLLEVTAAWAQSSIIPRSEEVLPFGAALVERLDLEGVEPAELLAGAESQFAFFFPAGLDSTILSRTQLDALLGATLLLESGIRRGGGDYDQARTLFDCYFLMYQAGRAGLLGQTFEALRRESAGRASPEETEFLELYAQSIDEFEEHGRNSLNTLGEVLMVVQPDDTEVVYALARVAEQTGDYQRAARLYRRGLKGERIGRRLLLLAEMQAAADDDGSRAAIEQALTLQPELREQLDAMNERVDIRRRLAQLQQTQEEGRLSNSERFELALLLRRAGRLVEALQIFSELADWDDGPDDLVEEHAIAAMEANLPGRMREIMDATRDRSQPSARLLQLRIVAESLQLVAAAAQSEEGIRFDDFLQSDEGANIRADLQAFESLDESRAQFVRVYLELMTALVTLRLTGSLDESAMQSIRSRIDQWIADRSDDVAGQRFRLMLALYSRDREQLSQALEGYRNFCRDHDCESEFRRVACMVTLQMAASEGELVLLRGVDPILDDWPSTERTPLYYLVRGTLEMLRAQLGNVSTSDREAARQSAQELFLAGIEAGIDAVDSDDTMAADYAGLYNNLAYVALEQRDPSAAGLYLHAARRYAPNHPAILINLGVSFATRRNFNDAFVTFSLGASEAMMDPALTFQMFRWAGHIYNLSGRAEESAQAYARALALYEAGQDWPSTVDDGVFPGGPVEWGLIYHDDDDETTDDAREGLRVTLDLASPPLFFVPAPVSVLEMSAATEDLQ